MSRYLLLFLLNAPIVIAAIVSSVVDFKMSKISKKKFTFRFIFWLLVLSTLALAYPIYQFLFDKKLTESEPLSLFDVGQITFIVFLLFSVSRLQARAETLERKFKDLHQELSIKLSE
jgi:hypothetical protein